MKKNINIGFKEFKEKIHKDFYEDFLTEIFFRWLSNMIAYILIKYTNIKANQITLLSLVVVLLSSFLAFYWIYINSFVLIWIWFFWFILFHLFDSVDWDLARARNKILWEKYSINGSHFDALIHQYYNFLFFSMIWYFIFTVTNNMLFVIFWVVWWLLMVINDIMFAYKDYIKLKNNYANKDRNYRNFKLKNEKKFSIKDVIISFIWMIWFSIIYFLLFVFSLIIDNYMFLICFFIVNLLAIFILHIKQFVDFYKFTG